MGIAAPPMLAIKSLRQHEISAESYSQQTDSRLATYARRNKVFRCQHPSHLPPERKPWMSEDPRMAILDAAAFACVFFAYPWHGSNPCPLGVDSLIHPSVGVVHGSRLLLPFDDGVVKHPQHIANSDLRSLASQKFRSLVIPGL